MRSNENPEVRSTLGEMYFKHLEMISRYKIFLQEVSDNLHTMRPRLEEAKS